MKKLFNVMFLGLILSLSSCKQNEEERQVLIDEINVIITNTLAAGALDITINTKGTSLIEETLEESLQTEDYLILKEPKMLYHNNHSNNEYFYIEELSVNASVRDIGNGKLYFEEKDLSYLNTLENKYKAMLITEDASKYFEEIEKTDNKYTIKISNDLLIDNANQLIDIFEEWKEDVINDETYNEQMKEVMLQNYENQIIMQESVIENASTASIVEEIIVRDGYIDKMTTTQIYKSLTPQENFNVSKELAEYNITSTFQINSINNTEVISKEITELHEEYYDKYAVEK